jgi:hypothetical protein
MDDGTAGKEPPGLGPSSGVVGGKFPAGKSMCCVSTGVVK